MLRRSLGKHLYLTILYKAHGGLIFLARLYIPWGHGSNFLIMMYFKSMEIVLTPTKSVDPDEM